MFNFLFFKKKISEKRKSPRKHTRNLMSVNFLQNRILNLVNLSEHGLQFSCPEKPEKDELIQMTINLAEAGTEVQLLGRVVWIKRIADTGLKVYRIGVSFVNVGQEAGNILRHFMNIPLKAA